MMKIAMFLAMLAPAHASLSCFNFAATPPGGTIDPTTFHAAVETFEVMDPRSYFRVVHENRDPLAWVDGPGTKNACAGPTGALSFMSHNTDNRKHAISHFKGLRFKFKEANHVDQFRITLADIGDWDPQHLVRSSNNNVGWIRMCGFSRIDDPSSLQECSHFNLGKKSADNDGCAKHVTTEVISQAGNLREIAVYFEVRDRTTEALIKDYAFDPNYGITELCWPGADDVTTVVVESSEYEIHNSAGSISLTPFAEGSTTVTVSKRPIGTVTIDIAAPDGVEVSPCQIHLNRNNYDTGVQLNVNVLDNWTGGGLQLTASNPDMEGYNGITTAVGLSSSAALPGVLTKCTGWGDPHFTTFDGKKHNNYLPGDHTWVSTPDNRLTVQGRQVKCGKAACTVGMALKFKHSVVGVFVEANGHARIAVFSETSPDIAVVSKGKGEVRFNLGGGGYVSAKVGYSRMLRGNILKWVTVALPETYKFQTGGFCGDFNGVKSNDPNSIPARGKQGKAWAAENGAHYSKVASGESLFEFPSQDVAWAAPEKVSFKACNIPEDPEDVTDVVIEATQLDPPVCVGVDTNDIPDIPECASDDFTIIDPNNPHVCDVLLPLIDQMAEDVIPFITACKEDVCLTGDDSFVSDALDAIKSEQPQHEQDIADNIFDCPLNCSFQGECHGSMCTCDAGFTGAGCEMKDESNKPLTIVVSPDTFIESEDPLGFVVAVQNRGDPSVGTTCHFTLNKLGLTESSPGVPLGTGNVLCHVSNTVGELVLHLHITEGTRESNKVKLGGRTDLKYVVDCADGRYYACRVGGYCSTKQWDGIWTPMMRDGHHIVGNLIGLDASGQLLLTLHGDLHTVYQTIDHGATLTLTDYDANTTPMKEQVYRHTEPAINALWMPAGSCSEDNTFQPERGVANIDLCVPEDGSWYLAADETRDRIYYCKGDEAYCRYTGPELRDDFGTHPTVVDREGIPREVSVLLSSSFEEWEAPSYNIVTPDGVAVQANHDGVTFTLRPGLEEYYPWCCTRCDSGFQR